MNQEFKKRRDKILDKVTFILEGKDGNRHLIIEPDSAKVSMNIFSKEIAIEFLISCTGEMFKHNAELLFNEKYNKK